MKSKIKNILGISLVLLFLLSATAAAGSASPSNSFKTPIVPNVNISPSAYGYAPYKVTFTDISTGGTARWKWWSYGDWQHSTSPYTQVTHTYQNPGTYRFYLKATNDAGSVWYYQNIYVFDPNK